jgi:hypothetical protein
MLVIQDTQEGETGVPQVQNQPGSWVCLKIKIKQNKGIGALGEIEHSPTMPKVLG